MRRHCNLLCLLSLPTRFKSLSSRFSVWQNVSSSIPAPSVCSTLSRRIVKLSSSVMGKHVTSVNNVCYKHDNGDTYAT